MAIDNELSKHIRLSPTADGKVGIMLPEGMDSIAMDVSTAVEFATAIVELASLIRLTMRHAMERNPDHDN